MADEQQRQSALALPAFQQVEHLELNRRVRRGTLVQLMPEVAVPGPGYAAQFDPLSARCPPYPVLCRLAEGNDLGKRRPDPQRPSGLAAMDDTRRAPMLPAERCEAP